MAQPEVNTGITHPDLARTAELLSPRPLAVITGASRGIGAAIAAKFSLEGMVVIGNHSDGKKEERSRGVRTVIEEGGGVLQVGDITTLEGRQNLTDAVDEKGGKLDVLVLNAASGSRELNVDANLALLSEMQDRMNPGGVVVFMQSIPSHFYPVVSGSFIPEYESVSSTKHEAERELRKKQKELEEKGIKLLFVCPPEVPDTDIVRLFNMKHKDESKKSGELSLKLGLPENIMASDVAEKVFDLIQRKDELPSGYIEFFNGAEDAQTALEKWYKPAQVGIQTLEHVVRGSVAVGRSIISSAQVEGVKKLHMVDSFAADEGGSVIGNL
ncbi:MAG: SDR family NAD(P)-dependent oxidoreductase, partial [Candidatus Levyibacteriota bacterium]